MQKKSAFTLVEISIVVLIIGILVTGVIKSDTILRHSKLASAKSLTKKSPVPNIDNLMLWYEATSKESFISNEVMDNSAISTWYDLNTQNAIQNNATSSGSFKPSYIANCMNSIPCLRFDGTDDYLDFASGALAQSSYTIFVVEQRRTASASNYFISGSVGAVNSNIVVGYRYHDTLTQAHWGNDIDYSIATYTYPIPQIHNFLFSKTAGKSYWLNNASNTANITNNTQTTAVSTYNGGKIGGQPPLGFHYSGDISEIIIYNRSLASQERKDVMKYLSKKYNIAISL